MGATASESKPGHFFHSTPSKTPNLTPLWKYTAHAENKNKVHTQGPGGWNSTPQLFCPAFPGVPSFPGIQPPPIFTLVCSRLNTNAIHPLETVNVLCFWQRSSRKNHKKTSLLRFEEITRKSSITSEAPKICQHVHRNIWSVRVKKSI